MNDKRRATLKKVAALLESASSMVERVLDEEQDSLDNTPENLQTTDRFERMEAVIDYLEEVVSDLDTARDKIFEAVM